MCPCSDCWLHDHLCLSRRKQNRSLSAPCLLAPVGSLSAQVWRTRPALGMPHSSVSGASLRGWELQNETHRDGYVWLSRCAMVTLCSWRTAATHVHHHLCCPTSPSLHGCLRTSAPQSRLHPTCLEEASYRRPACGSAPSTSGACFLVRVQDRPSTSPVHSTWREKPRL